MRFTFPLLVTAFLCSSLLSVVSSAAAHASQTNAPSAVPSQIAIDKQEMTFTSRGAQLSGTLYYPAGHRNLAAVVVFHGAALPSQDAALYTHLKEMLPPLGIAVFVFDRRGTGKSGGAKQGEEDFDVLSDDGVAALRMLSKHPRIDPKRIGFWGLSQGGWLTLLAASKEPTAAFAISVSAPMVTADVQMNFASANILRVKGYPLSVIDRAIAARRAVDDYARGRIDRATAEQAVQSVEQEPWYKLIYLKGNIDDPDWKQQISSDPLRSLHGSRVPTLLIFGQDDMWIPVDETIRLLKASGKRDKNITVRTVSRATHEMMLGTDPKDEIDPAFFPKFAPNAPEYFGLLGAWLTEHGIAKADFR